MLDGNLQRIQPNPHCLQCGLEMINQHGDFCAACHTPRKIFSADLNWFHEELKARRGLSYNWSASAIPGTKCIAATHQECPVPIGTVWFRLLGNNDIIEILDSYVRADCRRCGIRTYLHNRMIDDYPDVKTILTMSAAGSEAEAFLKKAGFRFSKTNGWIWLRP